LGNVSTNGYSWASSPMVSDNHNGGLLWFHGSLVNPLTGSDRSNAFTVRCVQASARPPRPGGSPEPPFFFAPARQVPRAALPDRTYETKNFRPARKADRKPSTHI